MKLNVHEWGEGDRTALLVHGLFTDHRNWWRVGPALAERSFRVLAPDLRGHGGSPRGRYTPEAWADDLAETLPTGADLAVGHSLAGMALALAIERLKPRRAVYVDPTWKMGPAQHESYAAAWRGQLGNDRAAWREAYPRWAGGDVDARVAAMERFDPGCIGGLAPGGGHDLMPEKAVVPSLVMVADPSDFVPPKDQELLRGRGFEVASVTGAGHAPFRDDFGGFMGALDRWLGKTGSAAASAS